LKDIVPGENLTRRKMGFGVPIGYWFRGSMKSFLRETLLSEKSLERGFFKPERVRAIVDEHIDHRTDHSHRLWSLMMLELWFQRFID
jgi:asparagine synthase (glutamine-hydrolysing)